VDGWGNGSNWAREVKRGDRRKFQYARAGPGHGILSRKYDEGWNPAAFARH